MIAHDSIIEVRYAETDAQGVANNTEYFEWFEVGRLNLLKSLGLPYGEFERMGYFLPVIEAHAKYKAPSFFDDSLRLRSTIKELPFVRLQIDYELFREEKLIATGYTVHACITSEGKPIRFPKEFIDIFSGKLA